MTEQDAAIKRIMSINRDMNRDEVIEAAIREELNAAYKRGYNKAYKQFANYKEDMGR